MSSTSHFVERGRPAILSDSNYSSRSADFTINGRFLTQTVTGVQRYAREVAAELGQLVADDDFHAKLCAPQNNASGASGVLWEQFSLPIGRRGPLLNLCNMAPLAAARQVVCIHDVNTFVQPDSYSPSFRLFYRLMMPLVARRAARLTSVSHFSAKMIERHLGVRKQDIRVLGNGHEHVYRWKASASSIFERFPPRRRFILLIASRAKHKNIDFIVNLAERLDQFGLDIWVAGGASEIFSGRVETKKPNVRWLGFVSDDDLAALYGQALCLAFPSRTEGFGLPIVEAMALRCPVVSSDQASMPEICGQAALLAEPDDAWGWMAHFAELAGSNLLRSELMEKGSAQVQAFSWRATAQGYREILREVAA